jgi:hypothetical protein
MRQQQCLLIMRAVRGHSLDPPKLHGGEQGHQRSDNDVGPRGRGEGPKAEHPRRDSDAEPGNKIDPLLGAGTPAGSCRRRGRCPQFSTFQSVFFNPLAATSTHGEVAVMFRSGDHLVAACVECGSRAVVIGGELTSDAFVRCGECESPRGTYAEFFEEIRARGMYADFRQEIRAALSENSDASCNDNHRAKQS